MRKAGILLAVSSLPSNYGIGDFGANAYKLVDILKEMQIKIWQILPLNPLGYGNSPYQAYSSFAGDSLYISIDKLLEDGLITSEQNIYYNISAKFVDYIKVREHKELILQQAFKNFNAKPTELNSEFDKFTKSNDWVKKYAVFITFKIINQFIPWNQWPIAHKNWIHDNKFDLSEYDYQIQYAMFVQCIFYRQWYQLKNYANQASIEIMGDIPIYVGFDSLDVWANEEMFLLDEEQNPAFVAGVPPDWFSPQGQLWGNPLYNWEALKANQFKFWIERIAINASAFDIIRIDHFRAFDTYWKIPAHAKYAAEGQWVEAPGYELFDKIYQELPNINLIAEDLGGTSQSVLDLRDHYKLKGMKLFEFDFEPYQKNSFFRNTKNTIIYTGTHDNDTLIGWYKSLSTKLRRKIKLHFRAKNNHNLTKAILKYILNCQAEYVILPIQDILGLGSKSRFNLPGTVGSPNWEWKLVDFKQFIAQTNFIKKQISKSKRN